MAWRRPGDKPLSEPMIVRSLTHICVTRPQWIKLSEVNLSCGDIFIVIKVSTQQEAIWLIVWAFVQTHCKVNPFPQQNKMCFTGNALVDFDYNACIYIVRYSGPMFVKKWQKCHEWSMRLGLKLLSEKELTHLLRFGAQISHTSLTLSKHCTQHYSGPWQCLAGFVKPKTHSWVEAGDFPHVNTILIKLPPPRPS